MDSPHYQPIFFIVFLSPSTAALLIHSQASTHGVERTWRTLLARNIARIGGRFAVLRQSATSTNCIFGDFILK
jgi:hypothetical protein